MVSGCFGRIAIRYGLFTGVGCDPYTSTVCLPFAQSLTILRFCHVSSFKSSFMRHVLCSSCFQSILRNFIGAAQTQLASLQHKVYRTFRINILLHLLIVNQLVYLLYLSSDQVSIEVSKFGLVALTFYSIITSIPVARKLVACERM